MTDSDRNNSQTIAIIGLGYVGLPLAIEFSKNFKVVGFDVNSKRIYELQNGKDITGEVETCRLREAKNLSFSSNESCLDDASIYIVTVPTPIDKYKNPDLIPLRSASALVGKKISVGDLVIYESTVFPGCTEDECVPILEKNSGLTFNVGFYVGYSPERINPGDKIHHLTGVRKVTSGSTPAVSETVDNLYSSIIIAGTFRAPSIKIAEAAKIIENIQRDLNIALINELSMLFGELEISTKDVLEAAATKWNFLPFQPGLVGGHCIGVDPYYLTHKALSVGFNPELILAGRRINDGMAKYFAERVIKELVKLGMNPSGTSVLVLGLTFKENCPDIRNTKIVEMVQELEEYSCKVDVHDPLADADEVKREYGLNLIKLKPLKKYKVVIVAVAHNIYKNMNSKEISCFLAPDGIIFDLKNIMPDGVNCIKL